MTILPFHHQKTKQGNMSDLYNKSGELSDGCEVFEQHEPVCSMWFSPRGFLLPAGPARSACDLSQHHPVLRSRQSHSQRYRPRGPIPVATGHSGESCPEPGEGRGLQKIRNMRESSLNQKGYIWTFQREFIQLIDFIYNPCCSWLSVFTVFCIVIVLYESLPSIGHLQ